MKFLSALITDARGSLGDVTAGRNPSGVYLRARSVPAQPRTASQVANRALFTTATQTWATLGATTIAGWNNLASTLVRRNTLGQTYVPTGMALFTERFRNLQSIGSNYPPSLPVSPFTWPVIDYLGLGNIASGGVLTQVIAVCTTTWMYWSGKTVLQATKVSPATRPFVARANFRNIPLTGAYVGGEIDILAAYIGVFGDSGSPGDWIYSRVRFVSDATGEAGPWLKPPYGSIS
jgi:hypothetical protein